MAPFSCIGIPRSTIHKEPAENESVWKIFSPEPLDNVTLDKLFRARQHVTVREFAAFPKYSSAPAELPSFVLDQAVFYTSLIEWAASAMDMSSISGRNAALLANAALSRHSCFES